MLTNCAIVYADSGAMWTLIGGLSAIILLLLILAVRR